MEEPEPYIIQSPSCFDPGVNVNVNSHHPYTVYILNSSVNSPRHSLETHAHLDGPQSIAQENSTTFVELASKVSPPPFHHVRPIPHGLGVSVQHLRQRSLTDCITIDIHNEMTALATQAPGSPPGLSGSKSSKSSSFHSSSLSGTEGILSDITHFEEIGLDEDHLRLSPPKQQPTHGMERPSRPLPRMSATTTSGPRGNAAAMTAMRDLTNNGLRPLPMTNGRAGNSHVPTHSLSLPSDSIMWKGYRNASTPSLALKAMSNCNRSRSPSPNPVSPMARPVSTTKPSPRLSTRPTMNQNQPPVRRGSWQPSRRSIKELEAEYNDEDDDLPEDASLWNVPLSPRPPAERSPMIGGVSPKGSPAISPERRSPLRTSLSAASTDSTQIAVTSPPESAISPSLSSPPTSPLKPKVMRGASTGTMPDHYHFQPSRSKSWNVVLSELSEEAKALTETLENHALTAERKHEDAVQKGLDVRRPSDEKLSRSKSSTVELPPLRRNNIMIDPLPISREKEKVLTRTRPSWLPPKSQKEERKHLKEYQRMMEWSREAEKRKAAKVVDGECAKDDTRKALLRIWEEHVLPNWEQVIREPRTRELWWRGVAPKSRGQVWQRAVGNELALTDVTYSKALQRAKDILARISGAPHDEVYRKEKAWFDAIRRDVKVVFPELKIFQSGGPLHDSLVDVLMAYSMYRSDVGYSHGTHVGPRISSLT